MIPSLPIIELKPIGLIHSSLKEIWGAPVQPKFSKVEGIIEIFREYKDGLKDLEGFDYIICIAYLHNVRQSVPLQSSTHWDSELHGIFAIRSPRRPNPIGLSVLKLLKIEDNKLHLKNLDFTDGTPVLDIKPFIPAIDNRETEKIGWIKGEVLEKIKKKRKNCKNG